jgi:hypothetical protein
MRKIERYFEKIVIVGNGFDLNLGFNTSYTDFIRSKQFASLLDNKNNLATYLHNKHNLKNWIDIENELKTYPKVFPDKDNLDNLQLEFSNLSDSLMQYLKQLDYSVYDKTSHAYKLLTNIIAEDFLILDFNYTNSTRHLLTELGAGNLDEKIINVHGSIDDGYIIFGVEDLAPIQHHVFLRKAFNPEFQAINVNRQLKNLKELFILGHSLGETDHMYFKSFFREFSNESYFDKGKSIHLYHFGKAGYLELLKQLDSLTDNSLTGFKQNNNFITIDSSK